MPRLIPTIPTMSLGHGAAGHSMPDKLRAAAEAGFKGIEVFYACLEHFSQSQEPTSLTPRDKLRAAAKETKRIADELGLELMCFQPLLDYAGIKDKREHAARLEDAIFRFELCDLLGCTIMQIPANFRLDNGVSGAEEDVVRDLRELADAGLRHNPPIRFAYEPMCWSTYEWTWQQGWNIIQKVDRPNFGTVLDAFHLAGYEYADPTIPGSIRPDGAARLAASLAEFVKTVDVSKVWYLQLADAERLDLPLLPLGTPSPAEEERGKSFCEYHVDGQQPCMTWSRNCRLFPKETERGAYLPVLECYKAFLELGFEGYVSLELFTRYMNDPSPSIPQEHAQRGWQSWERLQKKLKTYVEQE
ncbi:hypothetical protein JCM8097_002952 [Rhodosporidiobolus ruineniae]